MFHRQRRRRCRHRQRRCRCRHRHRQRHRHRRHAMTFKIPPNLVVDLSHFQPFAGFMGLHRGSGTFDWHDMSPNAPCPSYRSYSPN